MHNWSSDLTELKKHPQQFTQYKLEQQINFGLCGEKIITKDLMQNWDKLTLDPYKKAYLGELLWPKRF